MKTFILGLSFGLIITACAMSGKPYQGKERNMQDKMFEPCLDAWTGEPTGKFCNRTCKKRKKNGECKGEFKTIVKNFCDPETFKFFRSAGFILIDEDQVL